MKDSFTEGKKAKETDKNDSVPWGQQQRQATTARSLKREGE